MTAPATRLFRWSMAVESLTRPYPVSGSMIALLALVPLYIFIAEAVRGRPVHTPATALDLALPLEPAWALVYGALYFFLIALPVLVVRDEPLLRRVVLTYLTVWLAAYVCFLAYPTAASRPARVVGDGFAVWGLRFLYAADPPYNCFPSLHVAHSVVSAIACHRVHRRVGVVALVCAALVALSTLLTKQHYALDVLAGAVLAIAACRIFLRSTRHTDAPELDRALAPTFAIVTMAAASFGVGCFWILYRLNVQP